MKILKLAGNVWTRRNTLSLAALVGLGLAFAWRLGTLTAGYSTDESRYLNQISLQQIKHSPINAPHKLLELAGYHFHSSQWVMRLPSVIFAVIFAFCIYYCLQRWFGRTIAYLATAIAITTPWYLLASRAATPEILTLSPIMLGAVILKLQKLPANKFLWLLLCLCLCFCVYVPAGILFGGALIFLTRSNLLNAWKQIPVAYRLLLIVIALVAVAPLAWRIIDDHSQLRLVLGDLYGLPSPVDYLKNIGYELLSLLVYTPHPLAWTLGRMPIMTIAQTILGGFGLFAMFKLARPKALLLVAFTVLGLLVNALSYGYFYLLALAPLFVLAAGGLRYLYFQWHGVFPHNPIPRYVAFLAIYALVGLQVLFGVRYSLIAWPHNTSTSHNYVLQLSK